MDDGSGDEDPDAARCPDCGPRSSSGKEWVCTRPKDLPVGGATPVLLWRKRRWRCRSEGCPRQSFTEQRARTTTRLRDGLAQAVEDGRDQDEVARSFGVSWPTVAFDRVVRRAAGRLRWPARTRPPLSVRCLPLVAAAYVCRSEPELVCQSWGETPPAVDTT